MILGLKPFIWLRSAIGITASCQSPSNNLGQYLMTSTFTVCSSGVSSTSPLHNRLTRRMPPTLPLVLIQKLRFFMALASVPTFVPFLNLHQFQPAPSHWLLPLNLNSNAVLPL